MVFDVFSIPHLHWLVFVKCVVSISSRAQNAQSKRHVDPTAFREHDKG
jgi:hypothetical protein